MRASFDVLTQPWIPVVDAQGRTGELGILDALTQAEQWKGIQDPSPLVEYSIYRFLIVFLMDALRPQDLDALEELLDEGHFDRAALCGYVEQCQSEGISFDLFDERRPFLQTVYRKEWDREPKPVSELDYAIPKGNNPIHFDHCRTQEVYSSGQAMRILLEAQLFCTAGAQDYPSNVNGAPPWFALVEGENLFQTLVLGMISLEDIGIPFDEPPVLWRNPEEATWKRKVVQSSWLMGMLFPARRIHLIPQPVGTVSEAYVSQGMNYISKEAWLDPHVTYRYNDKGRFNWKPSDDETVWRNVKDLMATNRQQAPTVVAQFQKLFPAERLIRLSLYGVQTNQATYISTRRHDLKLPNHLLGDGSALSFLQRYIEAADDLARAVYQSLKSEEIPPETQTQAKQYCYHLCETELWQVLETLEQQEDLDALYTEELEKLCSFARQSADWALGQLNLRGGTMLKVMKQQRMTLNKTIFSKKKEAG